jgi:hypothetical protein
VKTIFKSLLFISLLYSIFYLLVIDDYITEKVHNKYSMLFEKASEIEPIDYYVDGEDSYAPIYTVEDQAIIDEADNYLKQAEEPFYTLWYISIFISMYTLATYGKELTQNPFYLRLAFASYISFTFFGIIYNFITFRFIVFSMILYFLLKLFKLTKLNKSKESSTIYIFAYIAIAILFNPFIQFHFGRDTWLFIDLFTIVIVLIEPFLLKTYFNHEEEIEEEGIKEDKPVNSFDLIMKKIVDDVYNNWNDDRNIIEQDTPQGYFTDDENHIKNSLFILLALIDLYEFKEPEQFKLILSKIKKYLQIRIGDDATQSILNDYMKAIEDIKKLNFDRRTENINFAIFLDSKIKEKESIGSGNDKFWWGYITRLSEIIDNKRGILLLNFILEKEAI